MNLEKMAAALTVALALTSGAACSAKTKTTTKSTTTVASATTDKATTTIAPGTSDTTATSSDTSVTTDTSSDTGAAFDGNLKDKLLTASEVPGSFLADGPATDSDGSTDTSGSSNDFSCDGKPAKNLSAGMREEASVSFKPAKGQFPAVTENLGHDTEAKVKGVFKLFDSTFGGCSQIGLGDSSSQMKGTIAPMQIGQHGDESSAYLLSLTSQGTPVKVVFAMARKGDLIVNVTLLALTPPNASVADAILAAAVDKM